MKTLKRIWAGFSEGWRIATVIWVIWTLALVVRLIWRW